jgi:hypothetical protein
MAAITKNINFFKCPRLLYFKPESLKKFLFSVMTAILDTGRADGHNFERGPPKDHFSKLLRQYQLSFLK